MRKLIEGVNPTVEVFASFGFGAALVYGYYRGMGISTLVQLAAGLFLHAAWDVYHHWTEKVVVRSMAEFCFVLDTLLALAIVIVTWRA